MSKIAAILAFLCGSYSIVVVIPVETLFRKKSRIRYFFLCPPPLCLIVIFPELFRPLGFFFPFIQLFTKGCFVRFFLFNCTKCLCDGVIGFLIFMYFFCFYFYLQCVTPSRGLLAFTSWLRMLYK